MNEDHIAPMTPLDQMLAQVSLQMLKAAVPYFPADVQRVFALYAKMMELSHTIAMFSGGSAELMMMSEESGTSQPLDILQQLLDDPEITEVMIKITSQGMLPGFMPRHKPKTSTPAPPA